ncbi:hypothetical protein [Streptomyces sp. B3I8]|uniref:hypothetical protein n=1 Tax=Streptomyces sp. B3I8 TaxID=3042303 RepID=UPI0027D7DF56|nr:hypothetical protein [Streptomyces sp. B3I8]
MKQISWSPFGHDVLELLLGGAGAVSGSPIPSGLTPTTPSPGSLTGCSPGNRAVLVESEDLTQCVACW